MAVARAPNCDVRVCELVGDRALITVAGELDLASRNQLAAAVEQAEARTVGDVVLDLTDLRFCDATGIDAMVAAHEDLAHAGRRLVLVHASRRFRRLACLAQAGFLLDTPMIVATRPPARKPKRERLS